MRRTLALTEQRDHARRLRREQTDVERTLWKALRSRQLSGLKFRRQHPVGPYIVDFCCLELKLAIELDGGQHALQTDADARRSQSLARKGYCVLRFWNHEVLMNLEGVLQRIAESAMPSPLPSPQNGEGG
jgi:adenine-specific DNA-methyltransferase